MTLTNHLLTGAALAKFLPLPLAVPLAFASHFVLDALPHFGFKSIEERRSHAKVMNAVVLLDCLVTASLIVWLLRGGHWVWLLVGLVAYSPDLLWVYRFIFEERFGRLVPTEGNRFVQFHMRIQRYERIWGVGVEVVYGVAIFVLLR